MDIITVIKEISPEKMRVAGCLVLWGERQTSIGLVVNLPKMQRAGVLVDAHTYCKSSGAWINLQSLEYSILLRRLTISDFACLSVRLANELNGMPSVIILCRYRL
jgi:hypothetical protein